MVDEIIVGFEDTIGEPVVAHELPDVLDWVELGGLRRQGYDGDGGRHREASRHVPVPDRPTTRRGREAQRSWRSRRDGGSSPRYCKRAGSGLRPCPLSGRPPRRCRSMRYVDRGAHSGGYRASPTGGGSCSSARCAPRPGTKSLLSRQRWSFRARLHPGAPGIFFKILDNALGLGVVAWAGRELAVTHRAQFSAERLLGNGDAEFFEYPLCQIDQPPAHHAVDRRDRAALDHLGDHPPLSVIELGRLAWRLAVQQTNGSARVKPDHPVPDDLETHTANLRGLCPHRAIVDRSKRQQSPSLRAILRFLRQTPQARRGEISPKQYRHGEPPSFAILNQSRADLGIPQESRSQGLGITDS